METATNAVLVGDSLMLRDWFATHAPPPPASGNYGYTEGSAEQRARHISEWAYLYAEAMLAERVKGDD